MEKGREKERKEKKKHTVDRGRGEQLFLLLYFFCCVYNAVIVVTQKNSEVERALNHSE
jgi:hypothetical protein